MKKNTDKGNSVGENNTPKQRKTSSKNGKIEIYLSSYYEFRYNTILGRTEYRGKNDAHFSKVGRYEINTLRRELDNDVGIITSPDNLYSIIESSFSPRINPIQEYFKRLPSVDLSSNQKRISAKMRKKTLEAYKQAYLEPTKLNNRKAVYLSRETQERADFIVRRLGDRGSNLSSFVENIVRQHLEEYGEDIEKWRRL